MDGVSRALGSPVPVPISGKTYLLTFPTKQVLGVLEQRILSERGDPIEDAIATIGRMSSIKPEMANRLLDRALIVKSRLKNYIDEDELNAFLSTREGGSMGIWLMMRGEHPEMELEEVEKIVEDLSEKEFERIMQLGLQAGGIDDLGNVTGPKAGAEHGTNGSTGKKQSEKSRKRTTTRRNK